MPKLLFSKFSNSENPDSDKVNAGAKLPNCTLTCNNLKQQHVSLLFVFIDYVVCLQLQLNKLD